MKLIVAVDENWGIGKNGDLLRSIPDDMRYFREMTKNAMLIMGYNTLLSFPQGKPLPGRLNIVLADITDLRSDKTITVNSLDELFKVILSLDTDELYVIGGGFTYRQLLPYCDTAYITKMRFSGDADTFIPDLDKIESWHISDESELKEYDGIKYSFVTYKNDSPVNIDFNDIRSNLCCYFKKKDDLTISVPVIGDAIEKEKYLSSLKKLIISYFKPLNGGINFSDIDFDDISLENSLKKDGYISDKESFITLLDKYSEHDILKNVNISKDDIDNIESILA